MRRSFSRFICIYIHLVMDYLMTETTEGIETVRFFRQGDLLSCDLFTLIITRARVQTKYYFPQKCATPSLCWWHYIIGRTKREVTEVFSAITSQFAKVKYVRKIICISLKITIFVTNFMSWLKWVSKIIPFNTPL